MYVCSKDTIMNPARAAVIGLNVAQALRQVRPHDTAKLVARDVGVAVVTVKFWLSGRAPGTEHLLELFSVYGAAFAARVLAATCDWAEMLRLSAEHEALRSQ